MKRIAQWTVLAIVLVATVLGAQSAPDKRDVVLDLGLPNGATPQLRITEGETGSTNCQTSASSDSCRAYETGPRWWWWRCLT